MPTTPMKTVRPLAPEDVREGLYVIPMWEVFEVLLRCEVTPGAVGVRRFEMMPCRAPKVYRVVGVFLPFVFVRDAAEEHATLDTRELRLAMVPKSHGKLVYKSLKAEKRAEKKGKKK